MRAFRDGNGKEWVVRIDVAQAKKVRAATGVDLTRLIDDKLAPLSALLADPIQFVDVLWVLCSEEARGRDVSDEAFGASLGGDSLAAATEAFVEALVDFFPDATRRDRIRRVIAMGKAILDEVATEEDHRLANLDVKEKARQLMSGSSSTNSPGSPESTPPI